MEEPAEEPVIEEPTEDVDDAETSTEETSSVTADAVPASPEGKPFGDPAEEPAIEEPVEEPVVEEPIEEPAIEEPVDAPAIEEPVEEPVAEESAEEPIETPDEAEILLAEPAEAEPVEEIETEVAFDQTEVVSGVAVTVQAEPGAFPANAALSVKHVPVYKQRQADAAIEDVRDEEANVVVSYTFDIKVIDPETGAELQPAEGCEVAVSFALAEAADQNLDTNVYHLTGSGSDMTAEKLDAEADPDAETVTATTDGFSLYTVEFTYNTLEYVMPGDTAVALSEILNAVGLTGEAEAVAVSNADLFSASNGTGEWIVTAHQAFSTTEWMKVTINGVVYEITVTDDASYTATFSCNGKSYSAGSITGTKEIPLSTILTPLEITGDVTAASVSEGQGMTVTTTAITLTKAFGTGWLRVTAGGTEYEITITSTPDSISVVLYGTLFFDKNGGSGIMDDQSVREYSTTVLPDCTFTPPDGYEFDQWEINGARYNAGATFTFGQTTMAKAIWKLLEGVHSITADYNNSYGDVVVSPTMAAAGEQVTVTVQPVAGKAVDIISYSYGSTSGQALSGVEGGVYTFSMPGENTKVSVTFKEATKEPIAYVDENGSSHSCNDYSYVRSTDTSWTSWVVASQNLTLDRRVTVSGTVNLILMDGKTLTVTGGIQVGEGSTLNIYAQSGNTGELIAGNKQNSYAAGIGGNKGSSYNAGTITVNGGQITATGGYSSAGIGGASEDYPYLGSAGNITIHGNANVVATGGKYSSGIGCGSGGIGGSITIDGNARVQARALEGYSGSGAAIGSGRGGYVNSITISGGTVIATGANMGSAIGNGNSNSGGDGGTISITGGDVTATATGSWGAGIGGLCKSITIIKRQSAISPLRETQMSQRPAERAARESAPAARPKAKLSLPSPAVRSTPQ